MGGICIQACLESESGGCYISVAAKTILHKCGSTLADRGKEGRASRDEDSALMYSPVGEHWAAWTACMARWVADRYSAKQ